MNVSRARSIDRRLGVPLCFLLDCWESVAGRFSRRKRESPVRKILFIKLSELGAIILAYPLLKRMKKEYPSAELFFMTFEKNRGIFKLLGGIIPEENILGIREAPAAMAADTLKALWRLRRERIDIVFDLEFFSRFSAIVSYLSKAGKRIGFFRYAFEGLYRGNLQTHNVLYNPLRHVAKNYLALAQSAGRAGKNTPQLEVPIDESELVFPRYVPDEKTVQAMPGKLSAAGAGRGEGRLFLINPGEGVLSLREWPIDNFIALSRMIIEDKNNRIIIIGTEGAAGKARLLMEGARSERCESLVGKTTLSELLWLFNSADTLISNDCGLAHLAMLSPIRKFIIFGPESPEVFSPLGDNNLVFYAGWPCSPCLSAFNHRESRCTDNKCLKAIAPGAIFARLS